MDGSNIPNLSEQPVIKSLMLEIDRLKKRLEFVESEVMKDHEKLERLEHEVEHEHEHVHEERPAASYGAQPARMTVGL